MAGDNRDEMAERRSALAAALVATGRADRSAFATVYRLTSAKLFGICLRICSNRQAAEDALSEVYLTVWRRAAAYDPGRGSAISWLSTLARNRAIDWIRTNGRKFEPDKALADLPSGDVPADAMMLDAENDHRLHRCLERLDDNQRGAIRTAFFDGCTYAQLAERRSVPLSTIKSWVRRGLMKLKDCLNADD
jgi:RNA polymerase sigma factor (sigma-70 family)